MTQLLVVFGATGQQGGSVAHFVLSDPALSARYRVRGITRDPEQVAARALRAEGAEIVKADLDDPASLRTALAGADAVFITTRTIYDGQTKEREVRQGMAAADAAVAGGARYIIYSTEAHCEVVSGDRHRVAPFDARGEVEAYIRRLPVRSTFFAPGSFMQNLTGMMAPRPVAADEGAAGEEQQQQRRRQQPPGGGYVIVGVARGDRAYPWIDAAADTGRFVGAALADPDAFAGRTLWAASELRSLDGVARALSARTGRAVRYARVPADEFHARLRLPPAAREPVVSMFRFIDECGYYGPDTEARVAETRALVPGRLVSLDEYIAANIKLA